MTPRTISLTQDYVALVDAEDYDFLMRWRWHAWVSPAGHVYAHYTDKCRLPNGEREQQTLRMHRIILAAPKGLFVDHRNGDGLDNRKANLRLCTNAQNQANRKKNANSRSSFKGVSWRKAKQQWHAQIMLSKKKIHLGFFGSEIEAAAAYDRAALRLFGAFAHVNTIGDNK